MNAAALKIDADAAYRAGLRALDTGDEIEVLPLLDAALDTAPDDARLWQVKALLHRSLEELAPSVVAFARAATLAPQDATIAHGHAHAALEAGLPAAPLFERALTLAKDRGPVVQGIAAALVVENGPSAAIDRLHAELRVNPDWLVGHWLLSRLRWTEGDRDGFAASIEAAVKRAPRSVVHWRQYIFILMHGGLHEQALAVIDRARAAAGPDTAFLFDEAACLTESWQLDAAERAFAALPRTSDMSVAIHAVRHLLRLQRPEEAAARAEPLMKRGDAHMIMPYLSIIWRLLGDPRFAWFEGDDRFVRAYDLRQKIDCWPKLAETLRALHVTAGQPLEQSVRGGTQTDGPLFSRIEPEICALRQTIAETVAEHVAQLPPPEVGHPLLAPRRDRRIRFTGAWSIRLQGAGYHTNHVHPGGWLSSALYLVVPPETADTARKAGWLTFGQPQVELGLDLPPVRMIQPKEGHLTLFPSTMWHGTTPFSEGERMTVAFDVGVPR
ncbi:2OG-Fe(II) oxygenase family protein [Sphingosinicella xenopeptidilytica]|uniref:2OG-Fe(II) oxygenase family protein n=1 Tax=Sphingosinicella xenopeptidilytica TaxID=364098 RepID=A0ABW3C1H0_SPHXN